MRSARGPKEDMLKTKNLAPIATLALASMLALPGCKSCTAPAVGSAGSDAAVVTEGSAAGSEAEGSGATSAPADAGNATPGSSLQSGSEMTGESYSLAGCTVTLPAAWVGKVTVAQADGSLTVRASAYPSETICTVYTAAADEVGTGDESNALISQTDLGDGRALCVMATNYSYVIPDARYNGADLYSDDEAAALLDLTTGGVVTADELDGLYYDYQNTGTLDPKLNATADYLAANLSVAH